MQQKSLVLQEQRKIEVIPAYILMHSIRERALKGTGMEKASILSIREMLLLCAVSVRTLKTKVIIDFAKHHPLKDELRHMLHYYSIRDVG